jgi:hypothetical protein
VSGGLLRVRLERRDPAHVSINAVVIVRARKLNCGAGKSAYIPGQILKERSWLRDASLP